MSLKTGTLLAPAATLGWLLLIPWTACASSAWRWSDAQGQIHYSDTGPPPDSSDTAELELPPATAAPAQGLRAGEHRLLQSWQTRRDTQQRAAAGRAAQGKRQLEQRRSECRTARERLHSANSREQRKQQSAYLRRHCW
jgi:hypothetical protein